MTAPGNAQERVPRIGSLCSGYGGLELGLITALGAGSVAWHVEYDKHPSAVLEARFPGVPNYGDVTTTDWSQVEPVDWLTAGYPCQPFSHAGKRKGSADERHLWPAVADAIGVLRPGRVLLENVAGHVSLGLDAVLADLAALGYDARWGVVRAADAGAPHNRARIFIVAADTRSGPLAGATAAGDGLSVPPECGGEPAPDAAERGRRRPEGQQRGLGIAERLATTAPDTDEPGRQGSESAGRRQLSARGVATDAEGSLEPGGPEGADATALVSPGVGASRGAGAGPATAGADGLVGAAWVEWGPYELAIRRWERVIGRPAPRPTEPGRTGERLSPRFVEWMQGLDAGYVTDILSRNLALKALGNGVVPQQAALAVAVLRHNQAIAA